MRQRWTPVPPPSTWFSLPPGALLARRAQPDSADRTCRRPERATLRQLPPPASRTTGSIPVPRAPSGGRRSAGGACVRPRARRPHRTPSTSARRSPKSSAASASSSPDGVFSISRLRASARWRSAFRCKPAVIVDLSPAGAFPRGGGFSSEPAPALFRGLPRLAPRPRLPSSYCSGSARSRTAAPVPCCPSMTASRTACAAGSSANRPTTSLK